MLITSDTIVWFEEKAIGKPKNKKDAFDMLKKMSGKEHDVFTSVSLLKGNPYKKYLMIKPWY